MDVPTALPGLKVGVVFIPYRYIALVLLMVQTSAVILTMRYSLTKSGAHYVKTSAVVMSEVFKVVASVGLLWYERKGTFAKLIGYLRHEMIDKWRDAVLLSVPACLYTLQNNLLFIALANLDGTTYQVTYQLKIFTAAIFSVILLGRQLDAIKWVALFLLMAGVSLVQLHSGDDKPKAHPTQGSTALGLTAVILACCTSGFAGVYFEKILKGAKVSVWMRNVQLGLFSVILGMGGVIYNDFETVKQDGFFQGYTSVVWVVVTLQGVGGLVIAAVIKYADNILKSFATSLSIIATGLISYFFMADFEMSMNFAGGTCLVMMATFLYGSGKELIFGAQPKKKTINMNLLPK
eukprot:m.339652 g.339652  ORF g.339652 m.339652 type:complete len:349 (-) comp18899_c0_seq1:23-1069(-)